MLILNRVQPCITTQPYGSVFLNLKMSLLLLPQGCLLLSSFYFHCHLLDHFQNLILNLSERPLGMEPNYFSSGQAFRNGCQSGAMYNYLPAEPGTSDICCLPSVGFFPRQDESGPLRILRSLSHLLFTGTPTQSPFAVGCLETPSSSRIFDIPRDPGLPTLLLEILSLGSLPP